MSAATDGFSAMMSDLPMIHAGCWMRQPWRKCGGTWRKLEFKSTGASIGQTVTPILRMPLVMLESKDSHLIGKHAVVNRVRKTRHQIAPHILLDDSPAGWCGDDFCDCLICCIKPLAAKGRNTLFLKLGRIDQFGFRMRMVNDAHQIARRAARMTSS